MIIRVKHDCPRESGPDETTCGGCERSWCDACDPAHGPLCPWCHGRGYSTAPMSIDMSDPEEVERWLAS